MSAVVIGLWVEHSCLDLIIAAVNGVSTTAWMAYEAVNVSVCHLTAMSQIID